MNIRSLKRIGVTAIPGLLVAGILFTISTLNAANPGNGRDNSQGAGHANQTARERADEHSTVDDDEVIFIDPITGNVGIGTTSPMEALHVVGNIKAEGKIFARAYSSLSPLIFEAPAGVERARIDDVTGNFGIGTVAPSAKLDVAGNVKINAGASTLLTIEGDTLATLDFRKNGATLWSLNDFSSDFRIDESGLPLLSFQGDPCGVVREVVVNRNAVALDPIDGLVARQADIGVVAAGDAVALDPTFDPVFGNRNRFIIKKCTGRVGIGAPNPKEKLHVAGGGITTDSFFSFSNVQQVAPSDSVYINAPRAGNLGLFTSSAERLTVASNGYVGIGTTAPEARLHVKGAGWPNSFLYLDTDGIDQDSGIRFNEGGAVKYHLYHDADPGVLRIDPEGTQGIVQGIAIDKDGRVGLGTVAPAERLDLAGGNIDLAGGNIKMGYEIVFQQAPAGTFSVDVFCPAGKKVLGGGCTNGGFDDLTYSFPKTDSSWRCAWNDSEASKRAYAICANIR